MSFFITTRPALWRLSLTGIALGLCLGIATAHADDDADKRARDEKRHLSSQITQLNRDAAALRQQLADEKAHSEELRKQAEAETAALKASDDKAGAIEDAAKSQLQKAQAAYDALRAQYDALYAQATKIDGERRDYFGRAQAYQTLSDKARSVIKSCVSDNHQLADIGKELIDRYKNKGFGQVLGSEEPFFQMTRVKLENLMQDYEDKLYDHTESLPNGVDQPMPPVPTPAAPGVKKTTS